MSQQALLVMDLQNSIVPRYAASAEVIAPFQGAIEAARTHHIPVIYVRVGFMEGYPEVHPRNKMFGRLAQSGISAGDEAIQIHESVKPQPGEPVITKVRVSTFAGSSLEQILRAKSIDTLILSGISTSGVVLSTLREAADKDFAITVLSDACLDIDPEVHHVLMDKVFPRQADVMTVEQWAGSLA
ncbi:nicotinamidase-related amidase [Paenibacillus cellulosilyticus]|uniref:Nicotinamidase-related amidase n=1 Tax=Paenibacillus cellulosilyticus TaxID=375489 RepID=A0A2V2Z042_9BACL|nr:cysteine hydrolase [Paenibacillus cellulosilyticus]PWW08638.1 nicotinamidase-related amidase [Paenibacillus cellulosilyticus]QKS48205.1 cysteine hydrolase [Paenibacillus cellulosilyticus]